MGLAQEFGSGGSGSAFCVVLLMAAYVSFKIWLGKLFGEVLKELVKELGDTKGIHLPEDKFQGGKSQQSAQRGTRVRVFGVHISSCPRGVRGQSF